MDDLFHQFGRHPMLTGGAALAIGGTLLAWLRRLPSMGLAAVRRRLIYTVEVQDREQCFAWFQQWLAAREESQRVRDLVVKTSWGNMIAPSCGPCYPGQASGNRDAEAKTQLLLSPAPGTQLTRYRGRPLAITRSRREITHGGAPSGAFAESITFRFFGANRSTIESMLAEVVTVGDVKPSGVPVWTAWGEDWRQGTILSRRSPESLALAEGLLDDIFADIRRFITSDRWYADRGIPYRRGYLLHGPPGTGKTTLAPVIAGELGWSVATLSLGDPSMCDAASDKIGVTLSGLLNVLDGIGSKDGRILFMTTNHPDRLDPALVRPGRIDRKVELGYATADQARRMFAWFFRGFPLGDGYVARLADAFADRLPDETSPAAIQEHLLRHREDPAQAARTFGERVVPDGIPAKVDARLNGYARHAVVG